MNDQTLDCSEQFQAQVSEKYEPREQRPFDQHWLDIDLIFHVQLMFNPFDLRVFTH